MGKNIPGIFKKVIISLIIGLCIFGGCKKANYKSNEKEKVEVNMRKPAVSGTFYPANSVELKNLVNSYLNNAKLTEIKGRPVGFIVPHAGFPYSGPVAAYSFKQIQAIDVNTIIIVGFNHRGHFDGISVSDDDSWETPFGSIKVDKELSEKLIQGSKYLKYFKPAFLQEHCIEVQLPFIQVVKPDAKIIPVAMGEYTMDFCKDLAKNLALILKERNDVIVLFSTDMSHYHKADIAGKMDKKTLDLIESLDYEKLYNGNVKGELELCGMGPVVTALLMAKEMGCEKANILKYADSGDITGDKSAVVGYTAVGFYIDGNNEKGRQKNMESNVSNDVKTLTPEDEKYLLMLARETLEKKFKNEIYTPQTPPSETLTKLFGVFVTLTEKGELRGCIGYIQPVLPLNEAVKEMVLSAAFKDPRFSPLTSSELKEISIEISVLTPLELIDDINKIEVGKHGIFIKKGYYSGLLLPQVATDYGWDRTTFIEQTCRKAGMGKDEWKKGAEIYIFSAQIFNEEGKEH